MKERAQELKAEARANANKADGESAVLAKIAEMPEPDRAMAKRLHEHHQSQRAGPLAEDLVRDARVCQQDGKVVCFFTAAAKFKARYATFGFNDDGEPRRRRHVADRLRAEGVDRRRRGKDRRAREESGELRTAPAGASSGCSLSAPADLGAELVRLVGAGVVRKCTMWSRTRGLLVPAAVLRRAIERRRVAPAA